MTISFDLDDTLIPGILKFDTESQNVLQKLVGIEPLRKGTIKLIKMLRSQGHPVYVYTSSLRATLKIRFQFLSYGLRLDGIINHAIHERAVRALTLRCSKYPPAFGLIGMSTTRPVLTWRASRLISAPLLLETSPLIGPGKSSKGFSGRYKMSHGPCCRVIFHVEHYHNVVDSNNGKCNRECST